MNRKDLWAVKLSGTYQGEPGSRPHSRTTPWQPNFNTSLAAWKPKKNKEVYIFFHFFRNHWVCWNLGRCGDQGTKHNWDAGKNISYIHSFFLFYFLSFFFLSFYFCIQLSSFFFLSFLSFIHSFIPKKIFFFWASLIVSDYYVSGLWPVRVDSSPEFFSPKDIREKYYLILLTSLAQPTNFCRDFLWDFFRAGLPASTLNCSNH